MRLALIIHRYGKQIAGGAEQLTRCYAELLREGHEVHVITTCAMDHLTWRNELPAALTQEDGISVHRFRNDFERDAYWHELHLLLLLRHITGPRVALYSPLLSGWPELWAQPARKNALCAATRNLPTAIQEEFLRRQGPFSSTLLQFLEHEQDNFDFFIFFTYLYSTTYFGHFCVPWRKRVLVPALHDEPTAYLPVIRGLLADFRQVLFLSRGERIMAERICGFRSDSQLIGMPVASAVAPDTSNGMQVPYLFYCGRIEGAKGAGTLFDNFIRFKQQHPSELKLVLAGHAVEQIPARPDIEFLGFVSEARKLQLMRDAVAFVHPSPFESFSIVLLEAFLNGTPALVNAESTVLAEHCLEAEAGVPFESYEDFSLALDALLHNPQLRSEWGGNGRRYVRQNYSREAIAPKLRRVFEAS